MQMRKQRVGRPPCLSLTSKMQWNELQTSLRDLPTHCPPPPSWRIQGQSTVADWGSGSPSLSSNPQKALPCPPSLPSLLSSFQLPELPLSPWEDLPGGEGGWLGYLANQFCATKCRASSSPEQTSQSLKGKIAPSHLCGWGES